MLRLVCVLGLLLLPAVAPLPGTRDDFRQHRQYYVDLVSAVREARAAGQTDNSEGMLAAVRDALASTYATWANFPARLGGNVSGAVRWGV